jgi:hypothetical protein
MFWRLLAAYSIIGLLVFLILVYRLADGVRRGSARSGAGFSLVGPSAKCPACGGSISWARPPMCRNCGNSIQIRRSNSSAILVITVVVSGLIASAIGAKDDTWLWTTILGALPLMFVLSFLTAQLFPPDLELTGDYRSVLYDDESKSSQDAVDPSTKPSDET